MNVVKNCCRWIGTTFKNVWFTFLPGAAAVDDSPDHLLDTRRIIQVMQPIIIVGLVAVGIDAKRLFARAILFAMAFLVSGFLSGFLFGIPKVLQGESKPAFSKETPYRQKVNTNLEEISDWLTKIIVGLGLFELKHIPSLISETASVFARSFPDPDKQHAVFCSAIIFFSTCGFLMGYLVTRLYLQGALGRADSAATPDVLGIPKQAAQLPSTLDEPEEEKTTN